MINLVAKYDKGGVGQFLHSEKSVELGFGFNKTLVVLRIDKENDAGDFGKVVAPETTGLCVTAEIEGRELDVPDGKFFRG